MTVQEHPAAKLFPLMSDDELADLIVDIRRHGLLEPIWVCDGMVLDGRNRLRACERAGVEPRFRTYKGDSPVAFVLSENLRRRHLTTGQRVAIAAKAEPLFAEEAKERQRRSGREHGRGQQVVANSPQPIEQGKARDQAAEQAGVSGRSVSDFKRVQRDAPDLAEEVEEGKRTLHSAVRESERLEQREPSPSQRGSTHRRLPDAEVVTRALPRLEVIADELAKIDPAGLPAEQQQQLRQALGDVVAKLRRIRNQIPDDRRDWNDGHRLILKALHAAGPAGRTDRELEAATGLAANTVRPRRNELAAARLVRSSGEKRKGASVWIATNHQLAHNRVGE